MNKKKLKENIYAFVHLEPKPEAIGGMPYIPEVDVWCIERVSSSAIEIHNPTFGYWKEIKLDFVRNIDNCESFMFPYKIIGVLNLKIRLILDGYYIQFRRRRDNFTSYYYQKYLLKM